MTNPNITPENIRDAIDGHNGDWRQAAQSLIAFLVKNGQCYSSGEIARLLRLADPSLRFSVPTLGEYVRDLFYAGSLPEYEIDDGYGCIDTVEVMQVSRQTQGLYPMRTPGGVSVFVYCPDQASGDAHDFEVYIPKPGEMDEPKPVPASQLPVIPPKPTTPITSDGAKNDPVLIQGVQAQLNANDLKATVNSEKRLCVTRAAFEQSVHLGGRPMKGGDPIFISFEDDCVNISQTPCAIPGEGAYHLAADRGRVLFTAQDPNNPFVPGTSYKLSIGPGIIKVDLTSAQTPTVSAA